MRIFLWFQFWCTDWQEQKYCGRRIISMPCKYDAIVSALQLLSHVAVKEVNNLGMSIGLDTVMEVKFTFAVPPARHALIWLLDHDQDDHLNLIWENLNENSRQREVTNG